MADLPSSIEAYLNDAGFSGTEILLLNKLLDQDSLTLRELASKTGKSTGVLDQAMKKLLKKGIVIREIVNDSPKYVLHSLQSIKDWMKSDMQQKTQLIVRKYENFDAFIQTIVKTKTRPEMLFFEGLDGMKRAYTVLLERGKIFLRYGPTHYLPEEDPLREFRAQYTQLCAKHEIFTRVITHDTTLGRRHQSRDPFEYRQTLLVDPNEEPFMFEKIIVGDTLACFHMEAEQACVIRYSDMAEQERSFFELLWMRQQEKDKKKNETQRKNADAIVVPMKTMLGSHLKDFFFSRRGLTGLGTCAAVAMVLTGIFFWQMANANLQKMREQVKSVAATGALQFDVKDLDQLQTKADIAKPEYAKVIEQLNKIRNQNPDLVYVYIVRPTEEKSVFAYVADADSLHPDVIVDVNKDGKIDEADENVVPGEKYEAAEGLIDIYRSDIPAADAKPYTDKWGTFIDGAAPIRDKDGIIHAHLGVNKWAKDMYAGYSVRNILSLFVILFCIAIGLWLTVFDQFILKEIRQYMKEQKNVSAQLMQFFFTKRSALVISGLAVIAGLTTFALYENDTMLNLKRAQDKILSIAATGALQFNAKDLDQLHTNADINKPEYAKVIYLLNAIRQQNDGMKYAYIMRPTKQEGIWEFVADADSLDPYAKKDLNGDGLINDADHLTPPGEPYDAKQFSTITYTQALIKPTVSKPSNDQWGNIISAWAPIKNASGSTIAILGIDKLTSDVGGLTSQTIQPIYYFLCIFLIFLVIRLAAFNRSLLKEMCEVVRIRKIAITISLAAIISIGITFGIYEYTQYLTLTRMQDKVVAIAITAAPQFDAKDINTLQVEDDWKRPEWTIVENLLRKIKSDNKDILYVYLFRKSPKNPQTLEFVADADSINPYANLDNDPANDVDMNYDGKIDGSPTGGDYMQWPGQIYPTPPPEAFEAYNGPIPSNIYSDQWGTGLSGYAPIKDQDGKVVAILAVDMKGESQNILTGQVFTPIYVFFIFFVLFILFYVKGFSKSLLHQLLRPFRNRLTILVIVFISTFFVGIVFWMYQYTLYLMKEEIGVRLMSIAATAAPEFSADDLNQLHIAADMKKGEYQRVFQKLNVIRKNNPDIRFAYITRFTKTPGIEEFVADADSNYYIPFENSYDYNDDGKFDSADEGVYPGKAADAEHLTPLANKYEANGPMYEQQAIPDQWGIWFSGFAPIRDSKGNTIAILGIDMDISDIYKSVWRKINIDNLF